jgi:hypothetical protein
MEFQLVFQLQNFPDGTEDEDEDEDEAYGTLPSSERESIRLNLNILA